jgi:phosphonate transport system permease protein
MTLPKPPKKNRARNLLLLLVVVALFVWAFMGIEFSGIKPTALTTVKSIVKGFLNPDWGYVYTGEGEDLIALLIETLAIAILGTFISSILSIPFGFWSAKMKGQKKGLSATGKFVSSAIRTFPDIVLALIFIRMVGPGSFAGILALGIGAIGMLSKFYSESIETMDTGPLESVIAAGGNKINVLFFATLPQLVPEFLSYTLYRFEIAVRYATILGLVGAGGIGTPLIFALNARAWDRVGIILYGIIVMVTIIDIISGKLRQKLA